MTTPQLSMLKPGEILPALEIPITATQIVSGALASQDFEDVHHDKAAANGKGTPDIFMNILTTNGLVGRYLTDWAGPQSSIQRIKLSLGVPNFPGDCMVLSGAVVSIEDAVVEVSFKGKNGLGNHVSGSAWLQLPTSPEQEND
ncbi:MAG: MaoC family dehydratase [Gammaproteobacteria bacterium]|nr:MaoC family dehydratase [Gammaproteobacteria bacterium]